MKTSISLSESEKTLKAANSSLGISGAFSSCGFASKTTFLAVIRLFVIVTATFLFAGTVSGQPIEVSVEFGMDDLAFSKVNGYDLVEVLGDKCSLIGDPGEPWLPVRDIHILLPIGKAVSEIQADVLDEVELDGEFYIYPAQKPTPVSDPVAEPFVMPMAGVYESPYPVHAYPAVLLENMVIRGYYIAVVRLYPIVYIPSDGKLFLRSRIQLTLELEETPNTTITSFEETEEVFEELVEDDVVNPEDIEPEYHTVQSLSLPVTNDVKYLVICQLSMFDEFEPLLEWKTKKGVPAEAVSVEWIYSNYSGSDNQYKIKACIKDYVENKGTLWVVLAGDNTIIPDRDCYTYVGSYADSTIPTDLYYSGLDDMNWNDDGDSRAGEAGEDTIDMGPDVFVGRLPIRTGSQATAIINKTIEYEKNCPSTGFAEKMLLVGVRLWNLGDAEGKSENMYSGWINPYWNGIRKRFYDTATDFSGGASYNVTVSNLNERITNGFNFLHMATHGNTTIWGTESGGYYYASHAYNVNNPGKYVNITTIACITSAFDRYTDPCLSEGFIRNPNGGAVTYIGCARYGWGYATMSSHGTSFKYDRMFYKFLFNGEPSDYPQHAGAVYARMKEYWAGSSTYNGSMRWCQFGINLMGDPELCLYTSDPSTFNPSHPSEVPFGSRTFIVETGVAGARVCLYKEDEVYEYGQADGSGHYEASINTITGGTMDVTITAPNYKPYEGSVTIQTIGEEDNYEPNNFLAEAYDISGHEQTWLSEINGLGTQADDDWYEIAVGAGVDTIVVDCQFAHAQSNIDIALYDSIGTELANSETLSDNEYISCDIAGEGTYYIRVYGDNSSNIYDLYWRGYGKAASPEFSPAPGTYDQGEAITMSCSTEGAQIRYTTDGSDPIASSALYSGPLTLMSSTTLKAKAFKSGWSPSDISSGEYTIIQPDQYTLSLTRSGYGKVGVNSKSNLVTILCSLDFDNGEIVKLYPFPARGYIYDGWIEDGVRHSRSNPITVRMDRNRNIKILFKRSSRRYRLTIERRGGRGYVRMNGRLKQLSSRVRVGTGGLLLYPKAKRGYVYTGWKKAGCTKRSPDYPIVLQMKGRSENQKIYIYFKRKR